MNQVNLIGHLTKEVKTTTTTNGSTRVSGTIAIQSFFKDNEGKPKPVYIRFVAYGGLADALAKYTTKGSHVALNGGLDSYSYDAGNQTIYVTQLIVRSAEFLDTKEQAQQRKAKHSDSNIEQNELADGSTQVDIADDALPF